MMCDVCVDMEEFVAVVTVYVCLVSGVMDDRASMLLVRERPSVHDV
jgi:hypothetical protein